MVSPHAALAAAECSSIAALPDVVAKATTIGIKIGDDGGAPGAKQAILAEPLLKDTAQLSAALDACPDDAAKKDVLRAYASLTEEFDYQIGKGKADPRWPDPDDAVDLQLALKKFKRSLEKFIEAVPATKPA